MRAAPLALAGILWLVAQPAAAQPAADGQPAGGGPQPILRVDPGGPSSFVTSLAFGPQAQTLFAAGWDKLTRAWTVDDQQRFEPAPAQALRVPLGPGRSGQLNAVAVSPDARWIAVAGVGNIQSGVAGFRDLGRILPTAAGMTGPMRLDEGTIYLFDRTAGRTTELRGHLGPVLALAFAEQPGPAVLASAGHEWNAQDNRYQGAVRLWQVADRASLGSVVLPEPRARPQLAVLRAGSDPAACRVAIAWNDGALRLWDAGRKLLHRQANGQLDNSAVLLDNARTLATGSFLQGDGTIRLWTLPAAGGLQADTRRQIRLAREGQQRLVPRAIAPIASRGNANWDHLAIACLVLDGELAPRAMQLRVVSLGPATFGRTVATLPLWDVEGPVPKTPTLASEATGKYLAVGGSPTHEVQVFPVADLLAGRAQPQRLGSQALTMRQVQFMRRDQQSALLLRESGAGGAEWRFSLSDGKLQTHAAADGWQVVAADPRWTARRDGQRIELLDRGVAQATINVPAGQVITAVAVVPGRSPAAAATGQVDQPADGPLLAVAAHELGQPWLRVYHGRTGETLRELTGHTERITALAVSADSRLLASVAEDQTIRVWSLTDLDAIVGRHGMLGGVTVDRRLTVTELEVGQPAAERLRPADRLLGLVRDGRLETWPDARAYFDTWWSLRPGSEQTLRVERGGTTLDVRLPISQGIDERKPLFSLLVARSAGGADLQWVGWSPLGPFDSSDRRIEQLLGWHFNTPGAERPAAFAQLDQYRRQYFRPGLLVELSRDGALLPPRVPPLNRPAMSLEIRPAQDRVEARLAVDFAFPVERIGSVALRRDGQDVATFQLDADGTWLAELPAAERTVRVERRWTASLTTREQPPQEFITEELPVRLAPPPPRIEGELPATAQTTQEQVRVQARIVAQAEGQAFDAELRRLGGPRPVVLRRWSDLQRVDVDETVPLADGSNTLELSAVNRGAIEATLADETAQRRIEWQRYAGPVPPPVIQLLSVVSEAAGEPPPEPIAIRAGQTVVVDQPRIRVRGSVASSRENLTRAQRFVGTDARAASLQGFTADRARELAVDEPLELVAGPQRIRFEVGTAGGKTASDELTIEYRPRLPELQIISPVADRKYDEFLPEPRVELLAEIRPAANAAPLEPFEVTVLVNGQAQPQPAEIDLQQGRLRATVPLRFGTNELQLQVKNAWRDAETGPPLRVSYRPAPQLDPIDLPGEVDAPFVTLDATGWSERPIEQVRIGGQLQSPDAYTVQWRERRFRVHFAALPLAVERPVAERPALRLELVAEGSPLPAVVELPVPRLRQAPAAPAEIVLLQPARDAVTNDPRLIVRFSARSSSPLHAVQLWHNGQSVYRAGMPAAGDADSETVAQATADDQPAHDVKVNLLPGVNFFDVTAENAGGLKRESFAVSYVAQPVSLVDVALEPLDASGQPLRPRPDDSGRLGFDQPVAAARLWLSGQVQWNDAGDSRLADVRQRVQVWVNDYQQVPARLEPSAPGSSRRAFRTAILLNRAQRNVIEIGLPGLEREASSRVELHVDCSAPLQNKRLHLLIVGVGAMDQGQLVDSAVRALQAERRGSRDFVTAAFEGGRIYGPLTGNVVSRARVWAQLTTINRSITDLQQRAPANDVVMIYYQGGELVYDRDRFFLTTRRADDPQMEQLLRDPVNLELYAISGQLLSQFVNNGCGAHLLMLDVNRRSPAEPVDAASWPEESRAAMFRFAWLKPSPAPREARLIGALEQADPSSERLGQLAAELRRLAGRQAADALSYEQSVPRLLEDLQLR
ncbi:MAG: hypothetical protein J5I93_15550 [Pirellulaceae bacterium]|nr:hypothetical protein [Pirellulaceae bacterium]